MKKEKKVKTVLGKSFSTISTGAMRTIDNSEKTAHYRFIHKTIELCARLGVTEFSMSGVSVKFAAGRKPVETSTSKIESIPQSIEPVESIDNDLVQDFRRAQGLLEDPLGYEGEIIEQQLRYGDSKDGRPENDDYGTEFPL
jgi:hypothetical protein